MKGLEALEEDFADEELHQPPAVIDEPEYKLQDPARLSFPPSLPIELAMREQPVRDICESYNITRDHYEALCENSRFVKAIESAISMLEKDGFTFRAKAGLQAENVISTSYGMIQDPRTPANVRADLIKATVKWAGYEPKDTGGAGGNNFQININL
jgi:hypothetical protein